MSLQSRKSAELQDPGAELLDRLTAFWDRYGRIVLGAAGAIVVIAAVAYFTIKNNAAQNDAASERLAEADALFWRGDYDRSKTTAQEVERTWGSTASGLDAHRIAGDDSYWLGNWKDAVTEYRAYLSHKGSGVMANTVRRSLAYALESDKQYAEAAKLYDGLVGAFERESSAEFLAAAARCDDALGDHAGARAHLERLVKEFGDTSYAARARLSLARLGAGSH